MNDIKYNFDWQENKGYEQTEALKIQQGTMQKESSVSEVKVENL